MILETVKKFIGTHRETGLEVVIEEVSEIESGVTREGVPWKVVIDKRLRTAAGQDVDYNECSKEFLVYTQFPEPVILQSYELL